MKHSKNEIISNALEDPDVLKTIEGIKRTKVNTDYRDKMIEAFYFKFSETAASIFKEEIVGKISKYIRIDIYLPLETKTELQMELLNSNLITAKKIYHVLTKHDNLEFEIKFEGRKIISVQQLLLYDDELMIIVQLFFSGEKRIDKRIISTLNALKKRKK